MRGEGVECGIAEGEGRSVIEVTEEEGEEVDDEGTMSELVVLGCEETEEGLLGLGGGVRPLHLIGMLPLDRGAEVRDDGVEGREGRGKGNLAPSANWHVD